MDFFGLPATARASFACYNTDGGSASSWSRRCARRARCSADGAQGPLPRRDPRSQPAARAISAGSIRTDAQADGHNPLCGDRLTVYAAPERRPRRGHALRRQGLRHLHRLRLADDRGGQGQGSRRHRRACSTRCMRCSRSRTRRPTPTLGKLAALSGVREFPARVKCASLCWHTLNAALAHGAAAVATVSTE